jgi:hypothetical protein
LGNETADYLPKKGTKIGHLIHSAKLRLKRNIQVNLSEYYVIQSQHKSWNKIVKNRNIIPDFPRGDAVATFPFITGHDYLATHSL